jgi:hypothetical protein
VTDEPPVRVGAVEPAIAAELPGLTLWWCAFAVGGDPLRRSPSALRDRLRGLSDRHRGAQAITLRSRAIPHAYRVLFRHLGMEPDVRRIPVEELMVERLLVGAYRSSGLLPDALLAATVETEVGVWALDADRAGDLGLAERGGRIVVADADGHVTDLFAPPAGARAVTHDTRRVALYAIRAPGVPGIAIEEALWVAWEILAA